MKIIDNFKTDEYKFLMNGYACGVHLDDVIYPSVEHAFQAAKTLSVDIRNKIFAAVDAKEAKKIGKGLILRSGWDDMREDIMSSLLKEKFWKSYFRMKLLQTQDAELVAGGDKFWGKAHGVGENRLGKLLMKIRGGIADETLRTVKSIQRIYLVNYGWIRVSDSDNIFDECYAPPWDKNCYFDINSAFHCQRKLTQNAVKMSKIVEDEKDQDVFLKLGL